MTQNERSNAGIRGSFFSEFLILAIVWCVSAPSASAVNIFTNKGPALVHARSTNNLHLFFTGHNNDYIWDASYNTETGTWTSHGRILNSRGEVARTAERPAPLTINKMFFHGNVANHFIWYVDRPRSDLEWRRPVYLQYRPAPEEIAREPFLMKSAPAVHTFSWLTAPLSAHNVFYTDLTTGRLSFTVKLDFGWSRPILLPARAQSNVGPAVAAQSATPLVFYADKNTSEIFVAVKGSAALNLDDWTIVGIPRASTTAQPSVANINDLGVLLVYKGHDNNKIWLRLYRPEFGNHLESSSWRRLGYVAGIETDRAPSVAYQDGRIFLAIKLAHEDAWHPNFNVDVGYLEVDESNAHDTPGHSFESFR